MQAATPTPKDIVVVIDSSGSMGSTRMSKAKAAAQIVLSTLNPDDYFNVVDFDSSARSLQVRRCSHRCCAAAAAMSDNHAVRFAHHAPGARLLPVRPRQGDVPEPGVAV